jgi:hypothetical protein
MDWLMRHLWVPILLLLILFLGLIVIVAGLGREVEGKAEDIVGYGGPHSDEPSGSKSLFHTGVPIGGTKQGETYGQFNQRRSRDAKTDYRGFGCLGDCQVHKQGYDWAAARHLAKPGRCVGSTWSFAEGCAAFVLSRR